jgi:autotransporter translocation and assembly factor TamB
MQSIQGMGNLNYNWPHGLEAADLRLKMGSQTLAVNAVLENQRFSVRDFVWSDGEKKLAEGSASFSIPKDLNQWREMLDGDQSAVSAKVKSQTLSLGLLKEWVPALEKLDARSTGMVDLSVYGTYASPVVDVKIEVKELRSQQHPELPPADLAIALRGRDGQMRLDGAVQVPDFPVAVIGASMGFSPKEWLDDPGRFMRENVEAHLDLPELELSRFGSLIPGVDRLAGKVSGKFELSGEIGDPKILGRIGLTDGMFSWKNSRFPKLEGLSAWLDLSRQEIRLRELRGNVAGGSITGEGRVGLEKEKLGEMDFRLRADHVPIVRNDLFLLRVNADLRLLGPWDGATLSGGVEAVDSIFYRDIELLPIGTPFTAMSAAALPKLDAPSRPGASFPAPMRDWGLNLTVAALEPILIRGNLANGDVRGSVRIGGTLGKPMPQGKFTIRDFSAALPFSKFVVRSGTATFTPDAGFDPILEIRGTANPRPYRVTGYVYGRASNPQLVLTSSPPLPDHEIVTLLATGATTSGLEDPQAASSRALQLLVEELRRGRFRLGKSLRPVLGLLDRVDFSLAESDPYTSDSFSTATLSITDRWFLSAGMGETGDTRVFAIWRLSFH